MKIVPELFVLALMEQSLMDARHVLDLLELNMRHGLCTDTDIVATKRLIAAMESRILLIKELAWFNGYPFSSEVA